MSAVLHPLFSTDWASEQSVVQRIVGPVALGPLARSAAIVSLPLQALACRHLPRAKHSQQSPLVPRQTQLAFGYNERCKRSEPRSCPPKLLVDLVATPRNLQFDELVETSISGAKSKIRKRPM
jgi:hypothetical protein